MPPDAAGLTTATDSRMRPIEFDTARLRLRQWRASDFAPFAAMSADPRVMEFFPEVLRPAESHAMARRIRELIAARGWGLWAVEVRGGAHFIGFVGLHEPLAQLPFAPCVEIGWRLAPAFWGHGYATEAARGALAVGFEHVGLDEIVSFTSTANLRSQAVMQRIGMLPDGTFAHPAIAHGSPLREHVLYRTWREHWECANGNAR
tara:strand:+ start:429 stop:1040 length:612 start_codon:yes stop_codon:yes gene_type:complete